MISAPQVVSRDLSPDAAASDAVLQSAIRKAALRFVPLLTIAYLFNYLDRTSLSVAALTIYDMCKAMDKSIAIREIVLVRKTGGKSGDYVRSEG